MSFLEFLKQAWPQLAAWGGGVPALVSAWYWFKSALVKLPPEPKKGDIMTAEYAQAIHRTITDGAKANRIAAIAAVLSALLAAASWYGQNVMNVSLPDHKQEGVNNTVSTRLQFIEGQLEKILQR